MEPLENLNYSFKFITKTTVRYYEKDVRVLRLIKVKPSDS